MKKIKDNLLGDKQIFVFNVYVGNIDDADVEQYVNSVADRFQEFNDLEDVIVFYVPTRNENRDVIYKIR